MKIKVDSIKLALISEGKAKNRITMYISEEEDDYKYHQIFSWDPDQPMDVKWFTDNINIMLNNLRNQRNEKRKKYKAVVDAPDKG